MFFILSKIAWPMVLPSNFLIMLALLGVILTKTRMATHGRRLIVLAVALIAIAGFSPISNALTLALEQRFPAWSEEQGEPTGILILGGVINSDLSVYGSAVLNEAAERVTIVAALARRFPSARIVFSGGNSALSGEQLDEARFVAPLFESFGISRARVELERNSRNTYENAIMSKAVIRPQPGDRWLLVTSAAHMPRAVGCFRKVGLSVMPHPVDWRTSGVDALTQPIGSLSEGLARSDAAAREWLGLFVYWLTGRTSALFPSPTTSEPQPIYN